MNWKEFDRTIEIDDVIPKEREFRNLKLKNYSLQLIIIIIIAIYIPLEITPTSVNASD